MLAQKRVLRGIVAILALGLSSYSVSALADPMTALTAPVTGQTVLPSTTSTYGWGLKPAPTPGWNTPKTDKKPSQGAATVTTRTTRETPAAPVNAAAEKMSPEKPAVSVQTDRKVVIDIPSRTLTVFEGNSVLRRFPVGVGRLGFMTPLGKHQVIRKIENPGWENPYQAAGAVKIRPGANNPLGTRWIGFKADPRGEFGIHGTDRPQSVGKLSSHGCVRMRVPDAEQVFSLVNLGTPVEVTYQVVQLSQTPNGEIKLTHYPDWFKRGVPTIQQIKKQITARFGENVAINDAVLTTALTTATERPVSIGTIKQASAALSPASVETTASAIK